MVDSQVHVWYVDPAAVVDSQALQRCHAVLSADERVRQARYRFERHRQQYLVSHALVRAVLSQVAGVRPIDWQFAVGPYGRPEIRGPALPTALRFNLSHTDGLAACGVTIERDLGVDVEFLPRRSPGVELAQRYFSPAEVEWLARVPADQQQRVFFDFWTLKEAYIKARGMGLALPLDQFSFDLSDRKAIRIGFDPRLIDDSDSWQFAQHQPTPEHLISVAIRRGPAADLPVCWHAGDALIESLRP